MGPKMAVRHGTWCNWLEPTAHQADAQRTRKPLRKRTRGRMKICLRITEVHLTIWDLHLLHVLDRRDTTLTRSSASTAACDPPQRGAIGG